MTEEKFGVPSLASEVAEPVWRVVPTGSGFEDGINFYDDFDTEVVAHAIRTLHTALEVQGTPCYCLHWGSDANGCFRRFGGALPVEGESAPQVADTARIPLQHLVSDSRNWPLLAIREGPPGRYAEIYESPIREFLSRTKWQAEIRLQKRGEFVGYLKACGLDGSPLPTNRQLIIAAYMTKLEVESVLAYRHVWRARLSVEFRERLRETKLTLDGLPPSEMKLALRHVADMLTSHIGAGWNRAACYWPVHENTLECLWAQGGDGSSAWSEHVQRPLFEQVHDVSQLVLSVHRQPYPSNDLYYLAAAGDRPVQITHVQDSSNDNIIALLWRAQGKVTALPREHQRWELNMTPIRHMPNIDREALSLGGPIAVVFTQSDPWVRQVMTQRPRDPIFVSQNGQYFALPWFSRDRLIAIWIVDMAYWSNLCSPDVPSLVFAAQILATLGPAMTRFQGDFGAVIA